MTRLCVGARVKAALMLCVTASLPSCGSEAPSSPMKVKVAAARPAPQRPPRQKCPEWHPPRDGQDWGEASAAPEIPPEVRDIVSATRTVITIQGLAGKPACIPMSGISEVDDFSLSEDKRFLDFAYSGFETMGRELVDRLSGADIDVSGEPHFPDDKTRVVAANIVKGWDPSNQGIGVWEIRRNEIVNLFYMSAEDITSDQHLPPNRGYEVGSWDGNDCIELWSISADDSWRLNNSDEPYDRLVDRLPRLYYRLAPVSGKWRLEEAKDAAPCSRVKRRG